MVHYADALIASSLFSFVRDERREYDVEARRTRDVKTEELRAENDKLAAEIAEKKKAQFATPRMSFELASGLGFKRVDHEIARGRRAGDVGHRAVAFYLADCADRGLFQEAAFSNVIDYASRRHQISRRSARTLIAAGRALRELLKIDQAFIANELPWSKVRAIAKVAEVATEDHWLSFALSHSVEDVERESARAKKGEKPREDRKGLDEVRFTERLRVDGLVHEQVTLARQRLAVEFGRNVTDNEFLGAVIETFLEETL